MNRWSIPAVLLDVPVIFRLKKISAWEDQTDNVIRSSLQLTKCIWKSGVSTTMNAAIQLPARGPTDVDSVPAPAG